MCASIVHIKISGSSYEYVLHLVIDEWRFEVEQSSLFQTLTVYVTYYVSTFNVWSDMSSLKKNSFLKISTLDTFYR